MAAQVAWAEIKIVRVEKEKVHGLCVVRAEVPSIHGLKNVEVQRQISQILLAEVEEQFIDLSKDLETDAFCKEGVGNPMSIHVAAPHLSENLISIWISNAGSGIHPWYELKTYNFDPETGKKYSLRDLIPEETMGWLKERIKTEIEKEKRQRVDDLDDIGKQFFNEYLKPFLSRKTK
jgi:hypothetical protein